MADFNTLLAIKDLMTPNIETAPTSTTITNASKIMADKGITSVVLVDNSGAISGIITETDIVRKVIAVSLDPASVQADSVMNTEVHQIQGDASIFEARKKMTDLKVKHLIVEEDGKPVGLVSTTSLGA